MVTIRSHKHDRRRIFELMQRLGKLQARGTGHRDIEKHDIYATFHKHLDGGADARRLSDRADLARLLEQEAKLERAGASSSTIIARSIGIKPFVN